MIKHKSTENFESLPYICTLLNASLWTYYGITKTGEYLVATVNGFGILVEAIYKETRVKLLPKLSFGNSNAKQPLLGSWMWVFWQQRILVTRLALQGELCIDALGFICAGELRIHGDQ
ncbi:hypothetical protein Pint_34294 [Pistacia integerrima]|uniref:Uncharacterized protein n=1 Tax=Pistacia integerrima TaxID=434235 RepID=A0ACC0X6N6_9ROSI|nr:hypothetical protein Pint_34294 [Pistacia integerrima]